MHGIYILLMTVLICFAGFLSGTLKSNEKLNRVSVMRDAGCAVTLGSVLFVGALFADLRVSELIMAAGISSLFFPFIIRFTKVAS
ncbi:putative membrane protein YccC [Erwinia toletana]|uniref:Membrane protein YccC n=1 Tax=Winslowiella toletana TaxID=92490 RepID=A0ABS4PDS1_9GAMM|nr:hypothetical protein [Winslowiella toletana]MBP2170784.1 putative membrane protein YccC [Winslowiella toletana]